MTVEWKVSTTASIATLGARAYVNGAAFGTEFVTSAEPTSDLSRSFNVIGFYDQANRLTTATVAGVSETYTYDGDGVRFSRQVGAGPVTRFVTDPAAGLPVTLDDGVRKYVWGQGLAYAVSGTTLEVYHTDRLGSVRAITDAAGTITATYRTDEFGISTATTGTTSQPFGFTGEPRDATGLSYLRARYYDPTLGRFLSRDELAGSPSLPQSLNRYAYVSNNPQTYVDPSGRCWWLIPQGAFAGGFLGSILPVAGSAAGAATGAFAGFVGCVAIVVGAGALGAKAVIDQKQGQSIPPIRDDWATRIQDYAPDPPSWEPGKGPIGPRGPGRHIGWKIIAGTLIVAKVGKSLVLRPR